MVVNIMDETPQAISDTVPIVTTQDIVIARQKGRELAQNLGFPKGEQTRFATAISELTRNIITYAGTGTCEFYIYQQGHYNCIAAKMIDHGPGIDNPKLAMTDGYSSGSGLGLGLPGAKRLVHELRIESEPGLTQVVIIIKQRSID
jgi:serine/threonine-protein kinase RsbT